MHKSFRTFRDNYLERYHVKLLQLLDSAKLAGDVIRKKDNKKGIIKVVKTNIASLKPFEYAFYPYTKSGSVSKIHNGWVRANLEDSDTQIIDKLKEEFETIKEVEN